MPSGIRRWAAFGLVGLGGYIVQLGAIALLTRAAGWPAAPAALVAIELACLHNFVGHCCWTWREWQPRTPRAWVRRWGRFQLVKAGSVWAGVALTAAFTSAGVPVEAASTLAVAACALPNYFAADRLVFMPPGDPARPATPARRP